MTAAKACGIDAEDGDRHGDGQLEVVARSGEGSVVVFR